MRTLRNRNDLLSVLREETTAAGFTRESLAEHLGSDSRALSPGLKHDGKGNFNHRFGWDTVIRWLYRTGFEIRFEVVRVRAVEPPAPRQRVPYRKRTWQPDRELQR